MLRFITMFLLVHVMHLELNAQTKYWIQFTDKTNTPYTVTTPSAFLSTRSIQRRANQGIPVTVQDLPVDPNYISQVLAAGAVTILNRSKWFNAITIQTVDANALTTIQGFPFVVSVQPVQRYTRDNSFEENSIAPGDLPTAKMLNDPELQVFNYGTSFTQVDQIGMVCMHNLGFTGTNMVIAVLDAGFQNADTLTAFDSLYLQNRILGTWDFVANEASVYEDHWHGTMVLSCMGANWQGQVIGTAPHAKYWLLRTEEAATEFIIEEDNWVSGAEFADSVGADVLNTSLGYTVYDSASQSHTYADMDGNTCRISIATDIAVSKGMFAVASAGNSGASAWFFIGAPADADSVLAIGAVDNTGAYVNFSSKGPSFDGRVKPNVAAQGLNCVVASPNGGIVNASGTSFASPLTAGGVACLWQANPTYSVMQIFNAIQGSASQSLTPDSLLGYGISDFCGANLIVGGSNSEGSPIILNPYPNPFNSFVSFSYFSLTSQEIMVSILDISGKRINEENISVAAGASHTFFLSDLDDLAPGVYFLTVSSPSGKITRKLVKI